MEFLKSHISKYIGLSIETLVERDFGDGVFFEFLLKVLCILKCVILEIPLKFTSLKLIVLEGKWKFLQTVKNKISTLTLSRLCYDFEQ